MGCTLSVEVVVFPQWSQLLLAPNVPECELEIFELDCLHVEACCHNDQTFVVMEQERVLKVLNSSLDT